MSKSRVSLLWKLVLPVPIVLAAGLALAYVVIPDQILSNVVNATERVGVQIANQFRIVRGYYTNNVISKVIADGNLRPSYSHATEEDGVPLPATFIHDVSALLTDADTSVNLYSPYPFPNRTGRILDPFQEQAWAYLTENPDETYVARETRDGRDVLRVATADRMVAQGCVDCHNSHAETPRIGWELGDVRGILEVNTDITDQLAAGNRLSNEIVLALLVAGVGLTAVTVFFALNVARPLRSLAGVMHALADGDRTVEIVGGDRRDEVGKMVEAVRVFKDNAIRAEQLQIEVREQEQQAEIQRKEGLNQLADRFKETVVGIVDAVAGAATGLQRSAR